MPRWLRWAGGQVIETARHARARWTLYLPVLAIWGLAYTRVFIDPTPRIPFVVNWTPSLPYKIAWYSAGPPADLKRGEFVLFRFEGSAALDYPGLARQPFFKMVRGLPGDKITVENRRVFINGELVGVAKPQTFDHRPLAPIAAGVIPPGHLFVQGSSPDSFDSRYAAIGLVRKEQLLGRVTPLL
jgi:conjugal transfer pilin signal peptidase TrbI